MAISRRQNTVLLIDRSGTAIWEHEKALCFVGLSVYRLHTMTEAIIRLTIDDNYCCVVINEDTVPEYVFYKMEM